MVFVSGDRLHRNLAPLFLRPDQTMVTADELKAEMKALDDHYSSLPEEVRKSGSVTFAAVPPDDAAFLTTQLWDKYLPRWRELYAQRKPGLPDQDDSVIDSITEFYDRGMPVDSSAPLTSHDVDHMTISRMVLPRKGSWNRFSEKIERFLLERRPNQSANVQDSTMEGR
jgi:hypothetical protein